MHKVMAQQESRSGMLKGQVEDALLQPTASAHYTQTPLLWQLVYLNVSGLRCSVCVCVS